MAKTRGKKAAKRPAKKAKKTARKSAKRPRKAARKAPKRAAKPSKKPRQARRLPVATLRTPPSSLDMKRGATAAGSGRKQQSANQRLHNKMGAVTGGDVDVDLESAYFSGDGAPGGDNPTPDQNDVDDIGSAIGVKYNDNEELQGGEEVVERDRHRWENE